MTSWQRNNINQQEILVDTSISSLLSEIDTMLVEAITPTPVKPNNHHFHHHGPQPLSTSSSTQRPILTGPQHNEEEDYYFSPSPQKSISRGGAAAVITPLSTNADLLHQARYLFHFKAWSRLRYHAHQHFVVAQREQDPVGHFLEGFAAFKAASASDLSDAVLSLGKCLVLCSQIEGADLETIVWEQYLPRENENEEVIEAEAGEVEIFSIGDVMNLVQVLEEQKLNSVYVPPTLTQEQEEAEILRLQKEQEQQQKRPVTPPPPQLTTNSSNNYNNNNNNNRAPVTVPLLQTPKSSPPSSKTTNDGGVFSKQQNNFSTPDYNFITKPFQNTPEHPAYKAKMEQKQNSPNYNDFLENFIAVKTTLIQETKHGYPARRAATPNGTPHSQARTDQLRLLKKLSASGEEEQQQQQISKSSGVSLTPTEDFLARQRGEILPSEKKKKEEKEEQRQNEQLTQSSTGSLNNDDANNINTPPYLKQISLPVWVIALLVLFSYFGLSSLLSSTSKGEVKIVEKIVCPTTSEAADGATTEHEMKKEDSSSSSKQKKKKFGLW